MMGLAMRIRLGWLLLAAVAGSASAAFSATLEGEPSIDFNREIRQILSDNCFACHGPDAQERKGNLRLDLHEDALKPAKSGELAIVPGQPEKSELIKRITTKDESDLMPPPKTGKKLSPKQIELLTRWIAEGAKWDEHWAFVPPKRPALPEVKETNWPRNEIDHFVLARLEKEGLKPSPEAGKRTLARRASLHLTGLPPTPQEVDAFLADGSDEAYEKLVDRLLDSPRYGEHMARYWLDAARYADSHGYHIDSERSMWKWRDWVVEAFNKNVPFDQFTIDQLAGDLLPEPTIDQKIGSGYVRCNMSTGEGGAIVEEYQAKYSFDRVETTGTIWMGMTLTCARCHTHKYDPITHHEYYRLYAFFNNLNEAVMDGNKPNPDPFIKVPSPEQSQRQEWLKKEMAAGQAKLDEPMPELDIAQAEWQSLWSSRLNDGWTVLVPSSVTSPNGTEFKTLEDQTILAEGANPEEDVHELKVTLDEGLLAAIRLEALPHESLPNKASGRADDGRFRLSEIEAELIPRGTDDKPGKPQKLKFTLAVASAAEKDFDVARAIDGKADTGWGVDAGAAAEPQSALFLLGDPVKVPEGAELIVKLRYEASKSKRALGRFRLAAARNEQLAAYFNPPKMSPWQLIGPFKSEGLAQGFETVHPPEEEIDLKKSYPGIREEAKWRAKGDFEDGKSHLLVNELHGVHGVYYLYRTLKLDAPRKVELSLLADDLFKLWVNGTIAAERSEKEHGTLKVMIDLPEGENKILIKVVTHVGAAHFSFDKQFHESDTLPSEIAAILATVTQLTEDQQKKMRNHFRRIHSPEFKARFDQVQNWREEDSAIERAIPITLVARERDKPRETFLLMRGEYDQKGEKVEPGVPAIFNPFPKDTPTNRLGLAKWLLDAEHPLTARVTVNRFWQQYFGTGIVKTSDDFGVQGEQPSHPELLDWLATEFVRTGWDVKNFQRMIVLSAAYRQGSHLTPGLLAKDPENRLISRGPRFRLDAEMIRDSALFASGLLVEQLGGRSVKPYEPPGLWEAVSFNNSQKYVPDKGEALYRRSLYTHWKRQSPPPNMLLFDAPTREYCVVRRPRTNTPLQALALMNDPQFVDASIGFAQRILGEGGSSAEDRLNHAFQIATARPPSDDERAVLLDMLREHLNHYESNRSAAEKLIGSASFKVAEGLNASELAAWALIANLLLNLDETLTIS
jgi:mono/diheme cytochrome c family protein